jgi:hypothetical protein
VGLTGAAVITGLAIVALLAIVRARAHRRRRWAAGAAGERATAAILEGLEGRGFIALHDRRIPGMDRANFDHIVVGPTGVFTVETKRFAGRVTLRGRLGSGLGRLRPRHNGKPIDHVVDQAHHQADALDRTLGHGRTVTPLVVIHNAELTQPRFRRPITDGVRWCSADDLPQVLRRGSARLSRRRVRAVADALDRAL